MSLFFVQAEDGIRDRNVTGVQTCALPIFPSKYCPDKLTISKGMVKLTKALRLNSGKVNIGCAKVNLSTSNCVSPIKCAQENPTKATIIIVNVGAIRRQIKYVASITNTSSGNSELIWNASIPN